MPELDNPILPGEQVTMVSDLLARNYPDVKTDLVFKNPFELFVATVLSAQTTDEQVNRITKNLFEVVPDVYKMAKMKLEELEPLLRKCGLYKNKSRFLIESSKIIVAHYDGQIPEDFNLLLALPGVGRKTASVIISNAYNKPAMAVDTHVFRVSRRIGLARGRNPKQVEEELKGIIDKDEWINLHHRLIRHGRTVCQARKPQCDSCFLNQICLYVSQRREF